MTRRTSSDTKNELAAVSESQLDFEEIMDTGLILKSLFLEINGMDSFG